METKRDFIEFLTIGVSCIALGTLVAVSTVRAQDKSAKPTSACAPSKDLDAMCTVAVVKKTEISKICFGAEHPRCFELQNDELMQSMRGVRVQKTKLDEKQVANVQSALQTYSSWLETSHAAMNSSASCANSVAIDLHGKHGDYCLTVPLKKETDAKTKEIIATLERPMGLATSSR